MLAGCGGSQPPIGAPFSSSATRITTERPRTSITYRALYSFRGSADGESPEAALAEVGGSLYGTTYLGGLQHCVHKRSFCGTTFAITTSGAETQLYSFRGPKRKDGANPLAGLIDVDGTFYGTTVFGGGGAHTLGAVYSITPSGSEAVLYRFNGGRRDGALPYAGLTEVNGTLYGTTSAGGPGGGTVYAITTSGTETVLHTFGRGDGLRPLAGLLNVKGTLYGTTVAGGKTGCYDQRGCGTVFSVTTSGKESVLYSFTGTSGDGANPNARLINVKGKLYGTTPLGGTYTRGTVFSIGVTGTEQVLHNFGSGSDGASPEAGLINVKGKLYGTTEAGGTNNHGTVFAITASGAETVLHSFGGPPNDGAFPVAGLLNVNGTLYGTTAGGGAYGSYGYGTVFALTP